MKNTDLRIFISGPISSCLDTYKETFTRAEEALRNMGFKYIMNPAVLPSEGFDYEQYIKITAAMLEACDVVLFLDGWEKSAGSQTEHVLALNGKKFMLFSFETAAKFAEIEYAHD